MSRRRGTLFVLLMLGILVLATNRYVNPVTDRAITERSMSDSYSYLALASAAPDLPRGEIAFHHAQRIALPYLIGLSSRLMHLPLHRAFLISVLLLSAGITFVVWGILDRLQIDTRNSSLILALLILNPWTFREYLAFPELVSDLGFVFGLSIFIKGLLDRRPVLVIAGQVMASLSRQTSLLLIPAGLLWIMRESSWRELPRSRRTFLCAGIIAVALIIYMSTAKVASAFSSPNENADHLIGFLDWIRYRFHLRDLIYFVLLGAVSPMICTALALKAAQGKNRTADEASLLLCSITIWAQPLLAGPARTGGNAERLVTLGLFPVLVILALRARNTGILSRRILYPVVITLLGVGSLHHVYASGAMPFSENARVYEAVLAASYISVLLIVFADWKWPGSDVRGCAT